MSETAAETQNDQSQAQDTEQTTDQQQAEQTETDWKAEAEKWKGLSRKNEETAKKNAEAAKAWAEYQDSKKTEDQRREEQQQQAAQERETVLRENAVLKASVKHGLSDEDAAELTDLLEGVPADKLAERAEKLAARFGSTNRKPAPDKALGRETAPTGGASGDWLREAFQSN